MRHFLLLAALLILPAQAFCATQDEKALEADLNAAESLDRMTAQTDISQMKRDIAELKRDLNESERDVSELKRDVSELKRTVRT